MRTSLDRLEVKDEPTKQDAEDYLSTSTLAKNHCFICNFCLMLQQVRWSWQTFPLFLLLSLFLGYLMSQQHAKCFLSRTNAKCFLSRTDSTETTEVAGQSLVPHLVTVSDPGPATQCTDSARSGFSQASVHVFNLFWTHLL